jgi:iron complex outermembrane receptor protein
LFVPVQFQNLLQATTTGVEIAARWTPVSWWRLEGGYSTFHLTPHVSSESRDTAAASFDGNAPGTQWQVRSALSLAPRTQLDTTLFHTGALSALGIAAYTRADARVEVALTRQLSASLVGQNLCDPRHAEYGGNGAIVTSTEIPRSAHVQLRWEF